MSKVITVVSAPITNRPTYTSGKFGRELYNLVRARYPDVECHFIPDQQSIHSYIPILQDYAKRGNVFFIYAAHGKVDRACGMSPPHCGKEKGGMIDTRNVSVLNNLICYIVACWTSVQLGRLAEEIGRVRSYVGFRAPVYVGFDIVGEAPYGKLIIDVWNQFPKVLLDGGTVAEGIKAFGEKTREYLDLFERKKDKWLYAGFYRLRFERNWRIMVPYGNLSATLL